jgi:hypothetical protein
MTTKKQDVTLVCAGVGACAVCCAGPILAFLAAIGLGTVVGAVLYGTITVVIGTAVAVIVVMRRRRRAQAHATIPPASAPVELTAAPARR